MIKLAIVAHDGIAVIATGYNGDLELPEVLRDSLNVWFLGRVKSALAGGQTIEEEIYLVDFPFDDRMVQAEASFVPDSQILLGTRLLQE